MNLKMKRSTRTPHSEEITIFDLDTKDEQDEPVNIGKADVHYLEDQIVGTLLIWQEYATGFTRTHPAGSDITLDTLIDDILSELTEPLGVATEYGIEIYFPSVASHQFVTNYGEDEEEGDEGDGEETLEEDDQFASKLRTPPRYH